MKIKKLIKIALITVPIIAALLFLTFTIAVYNLKPIIKFLFNREINYTELKLNPLNGKILITDFTYGYADTSAVPTKTLIKSDRISADFSMHSLLLLSLSVNQIRIDNLSMFVLMDSRTGAVSFPDFIDKKKKSRNFRLPIDINGVFINNGTIMSYENGKMSDFIKNINIIMPGYNSSENRISPAISAEIDGKSVKINGSAIFKRNKTINRFNIKINGYEPAKDRFFINKIRDLNVTGGIIDIDLNIEFITSRLKKSELDISGLMRFRSVTGSFKNYHISDAEGMVRLDNYDLRKNRLSINRIDINSGSLTITKPESLPVRTKESTFSYNINTISIKKLIVNYAKFKDLEISGTVSELQTGKETFSFSVRSDFKTGGMVAAGGTVTDFKNINIESLKAENFNPVTEGIINIPSVKNLILKKIEGTLNYSNKELALSGAYEIENFRLAMNKFEFEIGNVTGNINSIDIKEEKISFDRLKITGGDIKLRDSYLKNINLSLEKKFEPITVCYNLSADNLFENIELPAMSFIYGTDNYELSVEAAKIRASIFSKYDGINFTYNGKVKTDTLTISSNNTKYIDCSGVNVDVEKITLNPLRYNVSLVNADSVYTRIEMGTKSGFVVAGVPLGAAAGGSDSDEPIFHLRKVSVLSMNGDIFDDTSGKPVIHKLNGCKITIENYPSFIYPEGNLKMNGYYDKVNPISLDMKLAKSGIKGKLKGSNIPMINFSPYTEKFISQKINSGRLTVEFPFSMQKGKSDLKLKLTMNNAQISPLPGSTAFDMGSALKLIEDTNRNASIEIDLSGRKDKLTVDYPSLFFNLLKSALKKTKNDIESLGENVNYAPITDNFSVVPFLYGENTIENSDILKKDLSVFAGNTDYVFIINSFVDKKNDSDSISQKTIAELTSDGTGKLYKLYEEYVGAPPEETMTSEEISAVIAERFEIPGNSLETLAFNRSDAIKDTLMKVYKIPHERIIIENNDIYKLPESLSLSGASGIIYLGKYTRDKK